MYKGIKSSSNQLYDEKENAFIEINEVLIQKIIEKDKYVKYFLNTSMLLGSLGFLDAGISSYLNFNIIPFINTNEITFFPQGITMCFYGIIGLFFSINQFNILLYGTGEGYNEFNKNNGQIKIFRKGFPGKNSDINITYPIADIVCKLLHITYKINIIKNNLIIFTNKNAIITFNLCYII